MLKHEATALMAALDKGHAGVVNRLLVYHKERVREGIELATGQNVPKEMINLIFKFTY